MIPGYLLDNVDVINDTTVKYRGVFIEPEPTLSEKLYDREVSPDKDEAIKEYPYVKVNGVKHYYDDNEKKWFTLLNGKKMMATSFQAGKRQ